MPKYLRCRFISQPDLFAGCWREALESLVAQPAPAEMMEANGADVAAHKIIAALGREA
jgi:hypothetical protein